MLFELFPPKPASTAMSAGQVTAIENVTNTVDAEYYVFFQTDVTTPQTSIEVDFPADFNGLLTNGSYDVMTSITNGDNTGPGTVSINGDNASVASVVANAGHNNITVTLSSAQNFSGTVSFRLIAGITNPNLYGTTGNFTILTSSDMQENIPGVYIIPRINSGDIGVTVENQETGSLSSGVEVSIRCDGGVDTLINDLTDSHGNIFVNASDLGDSSSPSLYANADCDVGIQEGIFITVSKPGYAPDSENQIILSYDSSIGNHYTINQKYAHVITGITDELNVPVTPDSVTAGANDTPCVLAEGTAYCPVPTSDDDFSSNGFVIAKSGFVTVHVDLGGDRVQENDAPIVKSLERGGLLYAYKIDTTSSIFDELLTTPLLPEAVTAGANSVACVTNGSDINLYYCPVAPEDDDGFGLAILKDGYVTNSQGDALFTSTRASADDPQVEMNGFTVGLQYSHRIIVKDELNRNLRADTVTAGLNDTFCVLDNHIAYCPVPLADDDVQDETTAYYISKEGFVDGMPMLSGDRTAHSDGQQSVTLNGASGLDYAYKITSLTTELGQELADVAVTIPTVTAGDAYGTSCTSNLQGTIYYCPVPLANTSRGIRVEVDGLVTNTSGLFGSDRTASGDPQVATTVSGIAFSHKINVRDELGQPVTIGSGYVRFEGASGNDCWISGSSAYCTISIDDDDVQDLTSAYYVYVSGYYYPQLVDVNNPRLVFYGGGDQNRTTNSDAQKVVTMTAGNGIQFNHKVIVKDELGNALTPDTVSAGASDVSCSISGNVGYCPIQFEDDDDPSDGFDIRKDGYVKAVVNFGSDLHDETSEPDVVTMDLANGLDFAVKAIVSDGNNPISAATVTAGDGGAISCTNASGAYYCAVPLAHTNVSVSAAKSGYAAANGAYTDRTIVTDPQRLVLITLNPLGGGGGTPAWMLVQQSSKPPILPAPDPETPDFSDNEVRYIMKQANPVRFFVEAGSESSHRHGKGERASIITSFVEAFGREPQSIADWEDVLRISRGRWPLTVSRLMEARAYLNFRAVFGRFASMRNSTDVNALKMMAYGVRQTAERDLSVENIAIARFRDIFKFMPFANRHWSIVRAIAYSGLK